MQALACKALRTGWMPGKRGKILRCPAAVKGTKAHKEATVMINIMMGRRAIRPE